MTFLAGTCILRRTKLAGTSVLMPKVSRKAFVPLWYQINSWVPNLILRQCSKNNPSTYPVARLIVWVARIIILASKPLLEYLQSRIQTFPAHLFVDYAEHMCLNPLTGTKCIFSKKMCCAIGARIDTKFWKLPHDVQTMDEGLQCLQVSLKNWGSICFPAGPSLWHLRLDLFKSLFCGRSWTYVAVFFFKGTCIFSFTSIPWPFLFINFW